MLIPVEINIDDITKQFDISDTQAEQMCDNVAKSLAVIYLSKVENLAESELHSTRSAYLRNLKLVDSGRMSGTVLLDYSKDKLVRMIEEGAAAFDMKPALLASSKAKISAKGKKYITVPLRWGTKDSIQTTEVVQLHIPQELLHFARKKSGIKSSELLGTGYESPKSRSVITDSPGKVLFEQYKHKSSIYEGIAQNKDSVTGQSTYMSFRRISENSDGKAFIHPGIAAKHIFQNALSSMNIQEELTPLIDDELSKLGY